MTYTPSDLDNGDPFAPPRPAAGLVPPPGAGPCQLPCPVPPIITVRADLCRRPAPGIPSDPFGDPTFTPPGVRTVPEWAPTGVKSMPGGQALVGPGGTFVFPTPELPYSPRGEVIEAGEVVGNAGQVALETLAPGMPSLVRRVPWWAWLLGAAVVVRVLRGRRRA